MDYKVACDPISRLAQPITPKRRRNIRHASALAPAWLAFVSNWMTEWGTHRRDEVARQISRGRRGVSLTFMPLGAHGKNLLFGYDPATGKLSQLG